MFKSNFYCLLSLSALFCANSVNSFNSSPFSGDGVYYSPHLTNLTADPTVLAHIQKHQQREEEQEQQQVTYTDNEQLLLGSSLSPAMNSMWVNNSNSHNNFIDDSNTMNSVGGVVPQQDLYQQLQGFSPPPQVNLTNQNSIPLPISNSAPSNITSNNLPPVVTNTNWSVTPQPYFGGPQTNVNNGNCNPNNNYNHHHHSQQHQKHNINNTNSAGSVVSQQVQQVTYTADDHHHNNFIYGNTTDNASSDTSPVVPHTPMQQFTNQANSIVSLFPSYNTEMSELNSPSSNTFLAHQYLGENSRYLKLATALKNDEEVPNYYNPCSSTNMFACIHNTDLLMDIDDNGSNDDHSSKLSDMMDTSLDANNKPTPPVVPQQQQQNHNQQLQSFSFSPKVNLINKNNIPLSISSENGNHNNVGTSSNTNSTQVSSPIMHNGKDSGLLKKGKKKKKKKKGKTKVLGKKAEALNNTTMKVNSKVVKKLLKKNDEKHPCPTCHKELATAGSLKQHLKIHDPNRLRRYKCNICDKRFFEKGGLTRHIKRHNNEKPFQCDVCSMCFLTRYEKTNHLRTHTGEKRYQCNICMKKLSSSTGLTYHLWKHKGEKPFKCDQCDKAFYQNHRLNEHKKLHKDPKPYKCTQCTQAYATSNGLKYHIKRHNSPQPYTCHYCNASFHHKAEYKTHIRYEETTDENIKCHICKKAYKAQSSLIAHNKEVH